MTEIIIPKRRMERRNTAAALAALNEVLLAGEWCLETDTRKVKFGDGVTPYNSLLYVGELANLGNPSGDRIVYWDDTAQQFAFLNLGTGLTIGSGGDLDVTGGGGGGQSAIQFKEEGVNIGSSGAITAVDFVGSGLTGSVVGTVLTLTASGGGGGTITNWTSTTNTITATTTNPTKGAIVQDAIYWRRVGDNMEIRVDYEQSTAGGAGSGQYRFLVPDGKTIDATKIRLNSGNNAVAIIGGGYVTDQATYARTVFVSAHDTTHFKIGDVLGFFGSSTNNLGVSLFAVGAHFSVPIVEWA